jgi:hypothetical protein
MTNEQLVEIAGYLLALLAGGGSVGLIDWLKVTLGLSGHKALIAAAVVATVIAILDLIAQSQLLPGGVNWESLPEVFTAVFIAAQARFHMLRNKAVGEALAQSIHEVNDQAVIARQLANEAMAQVDPEHRAYGLADEGNHRDN